MVRNLTAALENLYRRSIMFDPTPEVEEKARLAALRVLSIVDIVKRQDHEVGVGQQQPTPLLARERLN